MIDKLKHEIIKIAELCATALKADLAFKKLERSYKDYHTYITETNYFDTDLDSILVHLQKPTLSDRPILNQVKELPAKVAMLKEAKKNLEVAEKHQELIFARWKAERKKTYKSLSREDQKRFERREVGEKFGIGMDVLMNKALVEKWQEAISIEIGGIQKHRKEYLHMLEEVEYFALAKKAEKTKETYKQALFVFMDKRYKECMISTQRFDDMFMTVFNRTLQSEEVSTAVFDVIQKLVKFCRSVTTNKNSALAEELSSTIKQKLSSKSGKEAFPPDYDENYSDELQFIEYHRIVKQVTRLNKEISAGSYSLFNNIPRKICKRDALVGIVEAVYAGSSLADTLKILRMNPAYSEIIAGIWSSRTYTLLTSLDNRTAQ